VPSELLNSLDYLFNLRGMKKRKSGDLSLSLWPSKSDAQKPISRTTAWRAVKRAMDMAEIEGPQATAKKGLRHGAEIALVVGGMNDRKQRQFISRSKGKKPMICKCSIGKSNNIVDTAGNTCIISNVTTM